MLCEVNPIRQQPVINHTFDSSVVPKHFNSQHRSQAAPPSFSDILAKPSDKKQLKIDPTVNTTSAENDIPLAKTSSVGGNRIGCSLLAWVRLYIFVYSSQQTGDQPSLLQVFT